MAAAADVRDFFAELGVQLPAGPGANVSVRCFADPRAHRHEDREPSCSVSVESGAWHCFACGARGGAYDAAMALGRDPARAMDALRRHALVDDDRGGTGANVRQPPGPAGSSTTGRPRQGERPSSPAPSELDFDRYRAALDDRALQRLRELRGWAGDAVRALGVGLDRGRVVFPVRDATGALAGMLRYEPDPARRNGTAKMLAAKGTRRELFPPPEQVKGDTVWLVEGEPDAVAGATLGLPAVGVPGAAKWQPEWAARLAAGRHRVVVVADCDEPGRKAAQRIAAAVAGHCPDVRVLDLAPERPDGYDLGDLVAEAARDGAEGLAACRALLDRMAADAPARAAAEGPNGAAVLDDLALFVRRFVVMTPAQATAVALWIVHTHAADAADSTPYLAITSAEKRSGKTRLLELLGELAFRPLVTANISDAALFRSIAAGGTPALLFDEIDAIFGARARDREDLRGMVNAGHRRGAKVRRCGGRNMTEVEEFDVFCPKALAGIGDLPDTVADRSIPVRLRRKAPGERCERARQRDLQALADPLRERAAAWAAANLDALNRAAPDLPTTLDDRAQDGAEPLLAIPDLAGERWPTAARSALVELHAQRVTPDTGSAGVRLLADIRRVFAATDADRLATDALLDALAADDEAPWADWYGKRLTPRALGKLLAPYEVKSRDVRLPEGGKRKGYRRDQFEDAWARYLPGDAISAPPPSDKATSPINTGDTADPLPRHDPACPRVQSAAIAREHCDVALSDLPRPREGQTVAAAPLLEDLLDELPAMFPGSQWLGDDARDYPSGRLWDFTGHAGSNGHGEAA